MDNRNTFFNKPQPPLAQIVTKEETRDVSAVVTHDVSIEKAFMAVENETAVVPPPPVVPVPRVEPIAPSFSLKNMLSGLIAHPNILPLLVVALVFFMGNQFGLGCQKQKEIQQRINLVENEHKKTLELMKELQIKSADDEAKVLKQVNDFYATLQQLDLKSEVAKTQLKKAQVVIEQGKKAVVDAVIEHNNAVEARINTIDERLKYFDMKDRDSTTNK